MLSLFQSNSSLFMLFLQLINSSKDADENLSASFLYSLFFQKRRIKISPLHSVQQKTQRHWSYTQCLSPFSPSLSAPRGQFKEQELPHSPFHSGNGSSMKNRLCRTQQAAFFLLLFTRSCSSQVLSASPKDLPSSFEEGQNKLQLLCNSNLFCCHPNRLNFSFRFAT